MKSLSAITIQSRQLSNALFLAAASLPFVLLLLLALTMFAAGPARASDVPVCRGMDLREKVSRENPEAYQAALATAAALPNAEGLLWKVENGTSAPSWLYGTMHVTDPRVTEISDEARAAWKQAGTMVIETLGVLDEKKAAAAMFTKPEYTMMTGNETIEDFLSENDRTTLNDALGQRGLSLALVRKMKPWLIASMVTMPDCEVKRKASGIEILDIKLARAAEQSGKRLLGLEEIGEQIAVMASLPVEFQVQSLIATLAIEQQMPDVFETMTNFYVDENVVAAMQVILAAFPESMGADLEGYAAFEEAVITKRNHLMAERAQPILEDGNAFIAVGALHLPGEEGVVELLRAQGWTVTRVQ